MPAVTPDIYITNHGSVWVFESVTPAAQELFAEFAFEPWQVSGDTYYIDHRPALYLAQQLQGEGFTVAGGGLTMAHPTRRERAAELHARLKRGPDIGGLIVFHGLSKQQAKVAEAAGLSIDTKLSHGGDGSLYSITLVTRTYVRRIFCPNKCYGLKGRRVLPTYSLELPECDERGATTVNDPPQKEE